MMIKVLAAVSHGMQGMRQTGCIAKVCVQTLCSVCAFDTSCSCAVEGDSVPLMLLVQLQGIPLQLMALAPLTCLCRHCPALLPEAPICRHIDAK